MVNTSAKGSKRGVVLGIDYLNELVQTPFGVLEIALLANVAGQILVIRTSVRLAYCLSSIGRKLPASR